MIYKNLKIKIFNIILFLGISFYFKIINNKKFLLDFLKVI